VTKVSWHF